MHPARSVRAHEYRLFDIAGPRCTGNQVDGARHVTFAQLIPGIFVGADDLAFRMTTMWVSGRKLRVVG